jgi:erythromycin esterase
MRNRHYDIATDYYPLETSNHLDPLLDKIGDARFVLLGEASHGTHEYYSWRTAISKRLIEEKGFCCIAVEGDWPDCYSINRFVKNYGSVAKKAVNVLKEFKRWPTWMWANWEIVALIDWLHAFNKRRHPEKKVGFYGLDMYSLWESIEAIDSYLEKHDPKAASLAKQVLQCFEPFQEEGHRYARSLSHISDGCRNEVTKLLAEIRQRSHSYDSDLEAPLNTQMNAQVIANAEQYYRSMISFDDKSWNIRDRHMATTLQSIANFHGDDSKIIVWEHNTHVGDARYTDMKDDGLVNVGQLAREEFGEENVFIVGFASYEGSVIAGRQWNAKMEKMYLPPAIEGSVEELLHRQVGSNRLLLLDSQDIKKQFDRWLPHRAVGVVYHPEYERGNYVPTLLTSRYDALMYLDETTALHPLHLKPDGHLTPDTYPFNV